MARKPPADKNRYLTIPREAKERGWRKSRAVRAAAPTCGAKCKRTGGPCNNPVHEEGKRCWLHGGATPSGSQWHRRQFPKPGDNPKKLRNKLAAWERRDREAAARRAMMTPEELERHERRRKALRPGTEAERAMRRHDRDARKLLATTGTKSAGEPSPEVQALADRLAELRAKQTDLDAELAALGAEEDDDKRHEVFG